MDISKISEGLMHLLPKVLQQVYLNNFKIDEKTFQDVIMPRAYNCKELIFRYCFFDSITSSFTLQYSEEPKLETLDFFMS